MAYCCGNLTGISNADSCETGLAGISKVYIACWSTVQTPVVGTNGEITSIVGSAIGATPSWKIYDFKADTGSLVSTGQRTANGMSSVTSVLTLDLTGMTAAKNKEINELRKSDVAVIVEWSKGVYTYLGKNRPVLLNSDSMESGVLFTDREGYSLSFQDVSLEYPHVLSTAAVTQLVGTA